jgi:hypothetical protein
VHASQVAGQFSAAPARAVQRSGRACTAVQSCVLPRRSVVDQVKSSTQDATGAEVAGASAGAAVVGAVTGATVVGATNTGAAVVGAATGAAVVGVETGASVRSTSASHWHAPEAKTSSCAIMP